MRWFLAAALAISPAAAGAQSDVQQIARQTKCGSVCGAATGTIIATSGPGAIESINVVNGTTAGFFVAYDAGTLPADGALDPALIRRCLPIAANTGIIETPRAPVIYYYGLTFFVSSNSCTTKTAVTYAFVNVQTRPQQ